MLNDVGDHLPLVSLLRLRGHSKAPEREWYSGRPPSGEVQPMWIHA